MKIQKWSVALLLFFVLIALLGDSTISRTLTAWPVPIVDMFSVFTRQGESDWILIPTLILWVISTTATFWPLNYRLKWKVRVVGAGAGYIFCSVALPGIISALLKRMTGRARPVHLDEHGAMYFAPDWGDWTYQSFPSGHTTTSFALATALACLFPRWGKLAYIWAILVGISRIVVEAHFLSDVIAGVMLGTVGALVVRHIYVQKRWGYANVNGTAPIRWAAPFKV